MKILVYLFVFIFTLMPFHSTHSNEYRILINIPSRTLDLYNGKQLVKTYPVGVGRREHPTPIGDFDIITKEKYPSWENPYLRADAVVVKPGRMNPLGTRWMGFYKYKSGEYGIHGTNNPSSVGKLCSHGCIRLKIRDAEDLFAKVNVGTPVKIAYYTRKISMKDGKVSFKEFPNVYHRKVNNEKMLKDQLNYLESA